MTDIYEIAEYTLEALKKSGADAAQCIVSKSKKDELNVDGGKFSLMRSTFNTSISMKAIKDGKKPYRNFIRNYLYGSCPLSYSDNRNR